MRRLLEGGAYSGLSVDGAVLIRGSAYLRPGTYLRSSAYLRNYVFHACDGHTRVPFSKIVKNLLVPRIFLWICALFLPYFTIS